MNSMKNRVQLIGRLGSDPELKDTANGSKLARLVLATNESYLNANKDKVDETNWHNLKLWGNLAASTEKHLSKGDSIAIEGRIKNNYYTDKEGEKHYSNEIIVHEYQILNKKEVEKAAK